MINYTKDVFRSIQNLQQELNENAGLSNALEGQKLTTSIEKIVTDTELLKIVTKRFNDGHHKDAVLHACIYLDNLVKDKSGLINHAGGSGLMKQVFSANNPILKINDFISPSDKDEQLGYMDIYAGIMSGIRNPRAHEHDWEDTESRAITLLIFINHLVEIVKTSHK